MHNRPGKKTNQEIAEMFINGIAERIREIETAYQKSQLQPAVESIIQGRSYLTKTEEAMHKERETLLQKIGPYKHGPDSPISSVEKVLHSTRRALAELEKYGRLFGDMCIKIENHIELEILPNDIFGNERVLLAQGRLIIPATDGYHPFKISYGDCGDCDEEHLQFTPLSQKGTPSLDEVLQTHVNPNMIGTVAIARNAEHYPLTETSLPIVSKKYEKEFSAK